MIVFALILAGLAVFLPVYLALWLPWSDRGLIANSAISALVLWALGTAFSLPMTLFGVGLAGRDLATGPGDLAWIVLLGGLWLVLAWRPVFFATVAFMAWRLDRESRAAAGRR